MQRYQSLSDYLRQKFKARVQKIPLDAGFNCPNRDGTLSTAGCIFCNPQGSGTGFSLSGKTLSEQYLFWHDKMQKKYKARYFLAYLQSFTNTYGPASKLEKVLKQIQDLPDLVGLGIGTRPDCLNQEKVDIIAGTAKKELWLEMGLQSANNKTLKIINRGHDRNCFAEATNLANSRNIKTCAHVIAGLPEEKCSDFLQTINFINSLPVQGIKFHNLYVCRGSTLSQWYEQQKIKLLSKKEYLQWLCRAINRLRPDIIIHRLNGDPAPEELLAPTWAGNKRDMLDSIALALEDSQVMQGQDYRI